LPEYQSPGVYVEETSFRGKSIEGVDTSTTGFVGPTRYGPVGQSNDILTSLGEFERIYGDKSSLAFADQPDRPNYLWHAVRGFFDEGGQRLHISRVFKTAASADDGIARGLLPASSDPISRTSDGLLAAAYPDSILVRARFPGVAGNIGVRLTLRRGPNILTSDGTKATVHGLDENDVVWLGCIPPPTESPPGSGELRIAKFDRDRAAWRFARTNAETADDLWLNGVDPTHNVDPQNGWEIRIVTLDVMVDQAGRIELWEKLPAHLREAPQDTSDSIVDPFAPDPKHTQPGGTSPIVIVPGNLIDTGVRLIDALVRGRRAQDGHELLDHLSAPGSSDDERSVELRLENGNDGVKPTANEYRGENTSKTGLVALEALEDISIVAAPGAVFDSNGSYAVDAQSTVQLLISHAERMKYRIAVLDSVNGQTIDGVRNMRSRHDSSYAALYYPWIVGLDSGARIPLPPSGFVAGIYARNDRERGVYKAPADEVVRGAIGVETMVNKAQQDSLNPEGINCFRFFEGRGFRLWGARTISSDPEWKYVNMRRYFAYLERSIDKGTQWVVFEPNGETLWASVRRTVDDFLLSEWRNGALAGHKPEEAFLVKCDRTTMTQNDLDDGRLICLIGVAPAKPAEFVIFRIGQWTADRNN
jgi:Bacteriophage tail sheath protein